MIDFELLLYPTKIDKKHNLCKGYKYWTDCGYEFDCGYDTVITCDECKYSIGSGGRKDPAAKCNQLGE